MGWYDKLVPERVSGRKHKGAVPEGVWIQCDACKVTLYRQELTDAMMLCTKCGHHHRIDARTRLDWFLIFSNSKTAAAIRNVFRLPKNKPAKKTRWLL